MACFLIKKNSSSFNNPWLGVIPRFSQEELFGKIPDILGSGGFLKTFPEAELAFQYIREKRPQDVGRMQVYELVEGEFDGDKLELKLVPWI